MFLNIIIFGLIVNLVCMILMWPRLQLQSGRYFMVVLALQWLWEWGYLLEINAQTMATAKLWDDIQYIPYLLLGPAWLYMARSLACKPTFKGLGHPLITMVLPLLFVLALVMDEHWQLIRNPGTSAFANNLFSYEFGPLVHGSILWLYSLIFASVSILFSFQRHINRAYRFQIYAVMFGLYLPLIASIPAVFGYTILGLKDLSPLSFALGNLAIMFGLFRMHAFEFQLVSQLPIISQLPLGVLILDHRERVIEWNPLAEEMLQLKFEKPGTPRTALPIHAFLKKNQESLWQKDEHYFKIHFHPLETPDRLPSSIVTLNDITTQIRDKKSLEITNKALNDLLGELTEAQERVLESEKHKSMVSLIQSLAHEFNTPLGNLTTVLDCFEDTDDPKEYTQLIQSNVSRVIQLIERIKKISAIKADAAIEPFNLKEAIEEAISIQRYETNEKFIEIIVEVSAQVEVTSSRESIENILIQLIENSRTHAFNNIDQPKIKIVATQVRDQFIIEYCDNGIGIPEALEDQLFLPFSNYANSMSISSGIGLFSVHQWVNQSLQGVVRYFRKDNGVCFKITCPIDLTVHTQN